MNIQRLNKPISDDLANSNFSALAQRVLANRGIESHAALDYRAQSLLPVSSMKGLSEASALLKQALDAQWSIVIVGDYDADGATSTSLLMRGLSALGFQNVRYLVPNRFDYGYGLTPEIVQLIQQQGALPELLITVDNGIASHAGVAAAKALGIRVLVTDHHLSGDTLPEADAIVNPNQPECEFASKSIAGVGVVFYVLLALRQHLRALNVFSETNPEPNLAQWLDIVALGTVADVVSLDQNNRILVEQGLRRIRQGKACAGIQALLAQAGRSIERLISSDLAFAVAPRLNAAGRLDDMSQGIECLLTDDFGTAQRIAQSLDALNKERREIEQDMQQQAMQQLEYSLEKLQGAKLPPALSLYEANWHQGVIGILASRIKERFHRPVVAFAKVDASTVKGSARSIAGYHIRDALDRIAKKYPDMLSKFGGHAMAAGLSLATRDLSAFQQALIEDAQKHINAADLNKHYNSDGSLTAQQYTLAQAEELRYLAPWGQHFDAPVFDDVFEVLDYRMLSQKHWKLVLQPKQGGRSLDAIAFNQAENGMPASGLLQAVFSLDVNEYANRKNLQLMIHAFSAL